MTRKEKLLLTLWMLGAVLFAAVDFAVRFIMDTSDPRSVGLAVIRAICTFYVAFSAGRIYEVATS